MSCYAFFKGWLLLSLPPRPNPLPSLPTGELLGTLAGGLGCLPRDPAPLRARVCLGATAAAFVGSRSRGLPRAQGRPTSAAASRPPYLNTFRGEPAITKFDKLITPSHKSSQSFATLTGAALRRRAPSACSWLAHPASGLGGPTYCKLLAPTELRLAGPLNLLAHYAKGTL